MHWKQGRYVLPALALLAVAGTAGLTHFLFKREMRSNRSLRTTRMPASPQPRAVRAEGPDSIAGLAPSLATMPTELARQPARKSTGSVPLTAAQVLALQGLAGGSGSANRALEPLRAWARRDPAGCGQWVLDSLEGAPQRRSLEEMVTIWTQQQVPLAALEWLDEQTQIHPDVPGLKSAYTLALSALARQDGANAAAWLRTHPTQGAIENWQSLLAAWAEQSAPAALQWTTGTNLDPDLRTELLPALLADFHDPAATALLLTGVDSLTADDAMVRAAKAVAATHPDFALGLARALADPMAREQAVNGILAQWLATDAANANSYAAQYHLVLPSVIVGNSAGRKGDPAAEPVSDDPVTALPR